MSYDYQEGLDSDALCRYQTKLTVLGMTMCPYKLPADSWIDDPTQWPPLSYPDLYHYLINTLGIFTQEKMKNYKALDSHRYFISGWVQNVMHVNLSSGHVLFMCDVRPSYRTSNEAHKPWVGLNRSGLVIAAHCNCMAGLGETCSHVAATLYKIEAAVRYGLTAQTCTDVPCQWNQTFTSSVEPAPIADIKFYSDTATKKISQSTKKREFSGAANVNTLLQSISKKNKHIVGLSLFKDYQKEFTFQEITEKVEKLPPLLSELYNASNKSLNKSELNAKIDTIISTLIVEDEEANYLEKVTRNQADSLVWHQHRIGRITGSVIYSLAHTSEQNPSKSLIKKLCYHNTIKLNTPAISWGRTNEHIALLAYFNTLSDPDYIGESLCISSSLFIHETFEMTECGLKIKRNEPWFGASPDSIVSCNCCGKGVVEVKCPFNCKDKSLEEVIKSDSFYVKKKGLFFHLEKNHSYYYQIQHEMYVCDVPYCDFVVWTPKEFLVTRVPIDKDFTESLTRKCFELWKRVIAPELLCKYMEETTTVTQATKLYCICQKLYNENEPMIGCDKCDEWFHLHCLKLKDFPKVKKWYCMSCRSSKKT